jgi:multiple sugar transport system permease protein
MSTVTSSAESRSQVSSSQRSAQAQRKMSRTLLYHFLVALTSFIMLYPILWLFASSFKGPAEIWTNVSSLFPQNPTLANYVSGWRGFGGITFATFYTNSFIYAGIGTLLAVVASALVAYGFARIQFVGRNIWFACMLMTLMLPVQVQIIPQYIMFSEIGWINTFYPLLLPRIGGQAFFIFMIMQFIRGIPRDLDEAAEIDGCGKAGIFFRIILPQITPALITAAIFSFYWTWEDFLTPLIYLNAPSLYTVSLALRSFADPSGATNWGAIFAMSSLSLVPVFLIFIVFQRFLVEGISTTGLK